MQRDNGLSTLHSNELVAGDVVMINEGMEIPADGWVIQSHDIRADESLITGENDSIPKEAYEKANGMKGEAKPKDQAVSFRDIPSPVVLAGSKVDIAGNNLNAKALLLDFKRQWKVRRIASW